MIHPLKTNLVKISFLGISICLLLTGCKPEKFDIVGKWTGKPNNDCPQNMFSNGITAANYEFLTNGVCKLSFEGNNGSEDAIVNWPESQFEVMEDSLILNFADSINVYNRLAFKIELKDINNITIIRSFTSQDSLSSICNSMTPLTRVAN